MSSSKQSNNSSQTKLRISLILNAAMVILELMGFVVAIGNNGWSLMGYYTQESNLVLLAAGLAYLIGHLRKMHGNIPYGISLLKFIATALTTVTFLVVVFCFVPMCYPNREAMVGIVFGEANLYHHFVCPLIGAISYLFFEQDYVPTKRDAFYAMLPTLCYAIVTTSLNVARVIQGPYPFLYVYEQPVWASVLWFVAIPGGGYLFARLFARIKRRFTISSQKS